MPSKVHRVTRGDDYRGIVRRGNRVGGALCITHAVFHCTAESGAEIPQAASELAPSVTKAQSHPLPARFGYIVSKAVGNAVTRNLVRRRLKTITERLLQEGFTGADVVIRALPAAADASFAELDRAVRVGVRRVMKAGGAG